MNKNKILLLTLVHPDFLPPVYAVGQVLRDLKFDIHILTFDSFVPAQLGLGTNIQLEILGKHYGGSTLQRFNLRNKFIKRAKQIIDEHPTVIITFCPFSFQCGLKVKKDIPVIYMALEIADFKLSHFLRSPFSNYRNLSALRNISKADLVATPSIERSAWLAGRCHLDFMPYTILNTAYLPTIEEENTFELFKEIVPTHFLNKKIILYTGTVSTYLCTMELIRAFDLVNDEDSALIITGFKDNEYCNDIKKFVDNCRSVKRIKLFPYLTRAQMLSLQSNAHIGVCITKEAQNDVKSKMMAPNKIGEYMSKNLHVLGIKTDYLKPFQIRGFASLANSSTPRDISKAIKQALIAVNEKDYKAKINEFVRDQFCMQQQLQPVIRYINEVITIG